MHSQICCFDSSQSTIWKVCCSSASGRKHLLSDPEGSPAPGWAEPEGAEPSDAWWGPAAVPQSGPQPAVWQFPAHCWPLWLWQVQLAQSHCRSAPPLPTPLKKLCHAFCLDHALCSLLSIGLSSLQAWGTWGISMTKMKATWRAKPL